MKYNDTLCSDPMDTSSSSKRCELVRYHWWLTTWIVLEEGLLTEMRLNGLSS